MGKGKVNRRKLSGRNWEGCAYKRGELLYTHKEGKHGFDLLTIATPDTPADTPLYQLHKGKGIGNYGFELVRRKDSKAYLKALLKPFLDAGEREEELHKAKRVRNRKLPLKPMRGNAN